jgi:hypothetical protein
MPAVQSANAFGDQAMQAMTMIAAPAFPTMHSSCSTAGRSKIYRRRVTKINRRGGNVPDAISLTPTDKVSRRHAPRRRSIQ